MRPATTGVGKCPFLNCAALWLSQYALVNGRPCDAVDFPLAVAALELEAVFSWGMGWWKRDVSKDLGETIGEIVGCVGDGAAYNETYTLLAISFVQQRCKKVLLTHDLISRVIVLISGYIATVSKSHILPCIGCEVKDDFPSLSN